MLFDLSELEAPPAARAWALADEEARRAISEDLDATLLVEAGAGSGKTSAMVERIVQLVRCRRAELRQIAAVTFTEAAAAELRTRVRRSLATAAGEDGDGSPASVALAQIDEAAIGTIHGFCQRLLAEHPLEAGLPPGFVVLDEVRASIAWRARWASTLDLLVGEDGTRQLVAAAWVLGMDHRHLETIARVLDDQWDRCGPTPRQAAPLLARIREAVDPATAEVIERLRAALSRRDLCREPSDGLLQRFGAYEIYLAASRSGGNLDRPAQVAARGPASTFESPSSATAATGETPASPRFAHCSPRQRSGAWKRWRWRATRRSAGSSRAWKLSPAGQPTSAA